MEQQQQKKTLDDDRVLLSCLSGDFYSTLVVNAVTGSSQYSVKGGEFSGTASSLCLPLPRSPHLLYALSSRPLLHFLSTSSSSSSSSVHSVLPGVARHVAVHPDQSLLTAAINDRLYTWMLTTGELLTIISGHYQPISRVAFTSDGSALVSAGDDGLVQVWLLVHLMTPHDAGIAKPVPLRKWTAHSLPVTDLFVTAGGINCRVLTTSADQTAALHSTTSGACLLTVITDCRLTSCTVDPAETRLFLGTHKGVIAQINLYDQPALRERHVATIGDSDYCPMFRNHAAPVTCIDTNFEGSMLVSGDQAGQYCIWDILSQQCLKSASMKEAITTARFLPRWFSLSDADAGGQARSTTFPIAVLQKQLTKKLELSVPVRLRPSEGTVAMNLALDEMIDSYVKGRHAAPSARAAVSKKKKKPRSDKVTTNHKGHTVKRKKMAELEEMDDGDAQEDVPETVEALKAELNKARTVNRQLYSFALSQIVDKS